MDPHSFRSIGTIRVGEHFLPNIIGKIIFYLKIFFFVIYPNVHNWFGKYPQEVAFFEHVQNREVRGGANYVQCPKEKSLFF